MKRRLVSAVLTAAVLSCLGGAPGAVNLYADEMTRSGAESALTEIEEGAIGEEEMMLSGGWDTGVDTAVSAEAATVFEKAVGEEEATAYEPAALLATQVVAGTNYCFLVREKKGGDGRLSAWSLIYVYEDLQGNASVAGRQPLAIGIPPAEEPVWEK